MCDSCMACIRDDMRCKEMHEQKSSNVQKRKDQLALHARGPSMPH